MKTEWRYMLARGMVPLLAPLAHEPLLARADRGRGPRPESRNRRKKARQMRGKR